MSESKDWRRLILICVASVCASAMLCCWMLRPVADQYAPYSMTSAMGATVLNKRTGNVEIVRPEFRDSRAQPTSPQKTKSVSANDPNDWGQLLGTQSATTDTKVGEK